MTYSQFLELFVSLSLQAALLIVITYWLGRLADSANSQSRLWLACFVGMLLLFVGCALVPHPRVFYPWTSVVSASDVDLALMETQVGRLVFIVWAAGAAIVLSLFTFQFICLMRFLGSCRPIDQAPESFQQVASQAVSALPANANVVLLLSSHLTSPFCWQFRRPCIALPETMLRLNAQEIQMIVRHEFEHLRTGHPLQVFLQRLVEVVFWFHPMVWWASYQASLAREFACDDAAVDSRSDIANYLRTLLKVVEQGAPDTAEATLSLDFGRGNVMIAKRATRLVQIAQDRLCSGRFRLSLGPLRLILLAAAAGIMLLWLPIDVLASPRAAWSPWPSWSARVLHDFGIPARDFEAYGSYSRPYEIQERARARMPEATPAATPASVAVDAH